MKALLKFLTPAPMTRDARRRETIANDDQGRETAEANAADAPIDGDDTGWVKISPFGTFPGSRPGRPQIFTETEANAIVADFNSIRGRLGRMFRGAPVYIGHPDQQPDLYTDHRRLGKITALQSRADGLWADIAWNSLGQENLREGYWVYPSPRWDAPAGRPDFRPDRLLSLGLTNTPRIPTSEPVTNSQETQDCKTQDARLEEEQSNNEPTDNNMDPKLIREKLGLAPEATDEEVFAKIDSMTEAADEAAEARAAKMAAETESAAAKETAAGAMGEAETAKAAADEAKKAKEKMANSMAAERKRADGAIIELAFVRGAITAADKPGWAAKLADEATRETAANDLANLKPALNTRPLETVRSKGELGDEKARREAITNAVNEGMAKGQSYTEAWNAAKRDPKYAPIFAAMK
jgi:hypothetical protein